MMKKFQLLSLLMIIAALTSCSSDNEPTNLAESATGSYLGYTNASCMTALTQYLTQHKLRKTPERYAILEKVFDMTDHFSVEALNAALHADGYHVSCTTVYNTLELLAEASLVRRRTFGRQPVRYEKITGLTNHHHLVCTQCGKVREIKDQSIDAMLSSLRFGTFRPAYADLYIYGVCSRCAKKSRAAADTQSSKDNTTNVKKQHNRS